MRLNSDPGLFVLLVAASLGLPIPEDIPLIANHLIEKQCALMGRPLKRISPELMQAFMGSDWPGNVRELASVIDRAAILGNGQRLEAISTYEAGLARYPGSIGLNKAAGRLAFTEPWKPDKLWDIHTPQNQYEVALSLLDADGKVLDTSFTTRLRLSR